MNMLIHKRCPQFPQFNTLISYLLKGEVANFGRSVDGSCVQPRLNFKTQTSQ